MTMTKTCYFTSRSAAERYYRPEGFDAIDVERKIKEGLIYIGPPPVQPGERLIIIDNGCRYAVEYAI